MAATVGCELAMVVVVVVKLLFEVECSECCSTMPLRSGRKLNGGGV